MPLMFEAHFQTFDDSNDRSQSAPRVATLRAELKRRGLDGFVVPRADRQQNEYLPASEERLAWLTGFTGSAGAAIVLAERAALFVDGRYTMQAKTQIDAKLFSVEHLVDNPPARWIENNLKSGAKLGYDPWLHTSNGVEKLKKACATAGAELAALDGNPIDALWTDRPAPPAGKVTLHDLKFAGESAADKLKRIQAELAKLRAHALVVSDPQNVAWAFNIRGADVAHTPLALAFAVDPAARAGRRSMWTAASSTPKRATALEQSCRGARRRTISRPTSANWRAEIVRLDQRERRRRADAADRGERRQTGARRRPGRADEGRQERSRDRRHTRRASDATASRWRGSSPGSTAKRPRAKITEIDAVEALESFRRDTGAVQGHFVPDHRRLRAERRDRALPRHPRDQPHARDERALPDRFRRAIRGRHHRHHAHRRDRRADRGNARPLHPRAAAATSRLPPRCFPRAPAAPSSTRWRAPASVGGPGSTSTTAPATASAAICRCTRARRASPSSARRAAGAA